MPKNQKFYNKSRPKNKSFSHHNSSRQHKPKKKNPNATTKVKPILRNEIKNKTLFYYHPLSAQQLASLLNCKIFDLIKYFLIKNIDINAKSWLNVEQIEEFCLNQNLNFVNQSKKNSTKGRSIQNKNIAQTDAKKKKTNNQPKPPVVSVMGHIDHGKTTLLDKIRNSNTISQEFGGITQSIGSYSVYWAKQKKYITLMDTPGHEAFTSMRVQGSRITDIAVIVIAGDDGVSLQTKEAINHALNAKIPIIFFINKMDKPEIDVNKILVELSQDGFVAEAMGGDTPVVKGSALKGEGIDELLETILLLAEINNLEADPSGYAWGTVIESGLNQKVGIYATLIVQKGTLHLYDTIVINKSYGRIRTMENELQQKMTAVKPGFPVKIFGLSTLPQTGEEFIVVKNDKMAKSIVEAQTQQDIKAQELKRLNPHTQKLNFNQWKQQLQLLQQKEVNLIIKASNQGMLEALKFIMLQLKEKYADISFNIIHSAIGDINEPDVMLARASNNVAIVGFQVNISNQIKDLIKKNKINFFTSSIVYQIDEYVEALLKDNIEKKVIKNLLGTAIVKKVFVFNKTKQVAGVKITAGQIKIENKIEILRNHKPVYTGQITSMQHFQTQVTNAIEGEEYGFVIDKYKDVMEGDTIQAYEEIEK